MHIEYYSQRLLNPFRGIVNTVKYQSAEAVSTDGLTWDIYVSNDLLAEGLDNSIKIQTSDIRYGKWSAEQGLKRGPIFPSDDFTYLEQQGAIALEHVQQLHELVPFPLSDKFELWLLDKQDKPLVLLDSAVHLEDIDTDCRPAWRAGNLCNRTFSSSVISQLDTTHTPNENAAEYLTAYINSKSATSPAAQWFERDQTGRARGLIGINMEPKLETRTLPTDAFPTFFINNTCHDAAHQQLINDFLDWQAPWLLLLPTLSPDTRRRYENLARKQVLIVEQQYRLYPEVIDSSAINSARVEALFRNSLPQPEEDEEKVLSTWYLELNPSSME